jgi:hypothetical protein
MLVIWILGTVMLLEELLGIVLRRMATLIQETTKGGISLMVICFTFSPERRDK